MSKLNTIKTMLQKILVSFNQISTTGGLLVWDSDNSLPEAGESVWALSESGERIPVEDKDYVTSDGTTIKTENGVVVAIVLPEAETPENNEPETEINEPEQEEQPREESESPAETEQPENTEPEQETENPEQTEPESEEQPTDEPERNLEEEVARLERENGELRERIAELENRIKELESEPAAMSAQEEFKEVTKITKTGNRQLDNLARIINAK